eukprot:TRINITY_DN28047_c0_g1_i1.p1 TRINITY_DN28047_c0_g1~~TRINITY_DN28047_c0_g1_i1.p1  ORF type:complete len:361 (+),score=61.20 TRINITY_DN28047_c0_g1_i1:107-1189(+)
MAAQGSASAAQRPTVVDRDSAPPPPLEGDWPQPLKRTVRSGPRRSTSLRLFRSLAESSWGRFAVLCTAWEVLFACSIAATAWAVAREGPGAWRTLLWALCTLDTGSGDYFVSLNDIRRWSAGGGTNASDSAAATSTSSGGGGAWVTLWYVTGFAAVLHQAFFTGVVYTRLGRPSLKVDISAWAVISAEGLTGRPCLSVRLAAAQASEAIQDCQLQMKCWYTATNPRTGRVTTRVSALDLVDSAVLRVEPGVLRVTHELSDNSPITKLLDRDEHGALVIAPCERWVTAKVGVRFYYSGVDATTGMPVTGLRDYKTERILFGRWADMVNDSGGEVTLDFGALHRVHLYGRPFPAAHTSDAAA